MEKKYFKVINLKKILKKIHYKKLNISFTIKKLITKHQKKTELNNKEKINDKNAKKKFAMVPRINVKEYSEKCKKVITNLNKILWYRLRFGSKNYVYFK